MTVPETPRTLPEPRPAPARRSVLTAAGTGLLVAGAGSAAAAQTPSPSRQLKSAAGRLGNPFTLGVASGEPTPDGVVLWTRLAPYPYAEDGRGGMPERDVPVEWEVAEDDAFRRIVRRGRASRRVPSSGTASTSRSTACAAGREYFYRFRAAGTAARSPRSAGPAPLPPPRSCGTPLTMAFASCAQYEHGWFTAYRHLAEEQPDLVALPRRLHLRVRRPTPTCRPRAATSATTWAPRR